MYIEWPQFFVIVLMVMDVVLATAKQGQPKPAYDVTASLVATGILSGLLYWGGFFQ